VEYFTDGDIETLTASINSYDLCLIFSVPPKDSSLGDVYIDGCVKKITIPKWFVQHDHHALSFSRNAYFDVLQVNTAYIGPNTLFIGQSAISCIPDNLSALQFASGCTIGGVNPGTIRILGTADDISDLPTTNVAVGDAYIIN
jgi:hypothetical protein